MSYPDGNPKTAIGAMKVPLHLVPPSATHYTALAFKDGAAKYGPYNWRQDGVSASVYYAAAMRHLSAWWDGEDVSSDALVHHLGHVMACCAIILDADSVRMLNDDRPPGGASPTLQAGYAARNAAPKYGEVIPHEMAAAIMRDLKPDDDEGPQPAEKPREHADGAL